MTFPFDIRNSIIDGLKVLGRTHAEAVAEADAHLARKLRESESARVKAEIALWESYQ